MPNKSTKSGVISEPPPTPVKPTSVPTSRPEKAYKGLIIFIKANTPRVLFAQNYPVHRICQLGRAPTSQKCELRLRSTPAKSKDYGWSLRQRRRALSAATAPLALHSRRSPL